MGSNSKRINLDIHKKILIELKKDKYNLQGLESDLTIPFQTLSKAISGKRNIPSKYFDVLIKELKI
jgi:hypothetical protein